MLARVCHGLAVSCPCVHCMSAICWTCISNVLDMCWLDGGVAVVVQWRHSHCGSKVEAWPLWLGGDMAIFGSKRVAWPLWLMGCGSEAAWLLWLKGGMAAAAQRQLDCIAMYKHMFVHV